MKRIEFFYGRPESGQDVLLGLDARVLTYRQTWYGKLTGYWFQYLHIEFLFLRRLFGFDLKIRGGGVFQSRASEELKNVLAFRKN